MHSASNILVAEIIEDLQSTLEELVAIQEELGAKREEPNVEGRNG